MNATIPSDNLDGPMVAVTAIPSTDHGPLTTDNQPSGNPAAALAPLAPRPVTHSGKVAHLPAAIRKRVCELIYDGTRYVAIIAWLKQNGFPAFNKTNLTRWRKGGYQDWLKTQQWLEHRDFKRELAIQQARTDDPTFHDAAIYLAQIQFYELLNRMDSAELLQLVRQNRKELTQLLKTFTHFNRYCLQRDKFRYDLQQRDKAARGKSAKRPFRSVTMEKICNDMNLK